MQRLGMWMLAAAMAFLNGCGGGGRPAPGPEPKAAPAPVVEPRNADLDAFAGEWEIVSAQPEGAAREARRLLFRQDGTYAALAQDGSELWAGTFDLDATASPKIWDHRSYESRKTGGDALGIYELAGDTLRVCCVVGKWDGQTWTGKTRPRAMALAEADALLELRRVKTGAPAAPAANE